MSFYPTIAQDREIEVTVPYKRRVGHEVEIEDYGEFCETARRLGLGTPEGEDSEECDCDDCYDRGGDGPMLHPYHCQCEAADNFAIHTTADDTAEGGEHIIGGRHGVLFASPAYMAAIEAVAEVARQSGSGGSHETGGHIHVSTKGLTWNRSIRLFRNISVVWPELLELAQGPWDEIRDNGCMSIPRVEYGDNIADLTTGQRNPWGGYDSFGGQQWDLWDERGLNEATQLMVRHSAFRFHHSRDHRTPERPTIEFRLWNTTTSRWRLYMSAGVSSALVEAAVQGRTLAREDDPSILNHLDGLLAPDVVALVNRQQAIVRGDVARAA